MPAACVVLDEFLAPAEAEAMLQYALECESQFVVSEVLSPGVSAGHVDYEHRRSRVFYDLGAPGKLVIERLQESLPRILPKNCDAVIDTSANTVVARIPCGTLPWGVAIADPR